MAAINLGSHLSMVGRYAEAEPLIKEGLDGNLRLLGPRSMVTLTALAEWGALLQKDRGRLAEAEDVFRQVLDGLRATLGEEHQSTIRAYNNLAQLQKDRGRVQEAQENYRHSIAGAIKVLGPEHPSTLTIMANLGDLLATGGDGKEGLTWLEKAVQGARKALPEKHQTTGVILRKYGSCLTGLRRYQEAEAALLEGHDILLAAVGEGHIQTRLAVRNLVTLYEAWGKPDRAATWKASLPGA